VKPISCAAQDQDDNWQWNEVTCSNHKRVVDDPDSSTRKLFLGLRLHMLAQFTYCASEGEYYFQPSTRTVQSVGHRRMITLHIVLLSSVQKVASLKYAVRVQCHYCSYRAGSRQLK
jgi:hypothetical protein